MKFRYYIVDDEGSVTGTNDRDIAANWAPEATVIDVETGLEFNWNGRGMEIFEASPPDEDEDEDEE